MQNAKLQNLIDGPYSSRVEYDYSTKARLRRGNSRNTSIRAQSNLRISPRTKLEVEYQK
jgi:hypothetical protein